MSQPSESSRDCAALCKVDNEESSPPVHCLSGFSHDGAGDGFERWERQLHAEGLSDEAQEMEGEPVGRPKLFGEASDSLVSQPEEMALDVER